MARPRTLETELRDQALLADIESGMSPAKAAVKYSISRSMVSQILTASTKTEEEIPEDVRARLIHLANRSIEIATEIADGPGRAITSGKGDHVYDAVTGMPAYDPSPRLDALRQIDSASTKLAKLTAADKPPAKDIEPGIDWDKVVESFNADKQLLKEKEELIIQLEARIRLLEDATPAEITDH